MAGYLVANYDITNEEGYQRYISTVGPTIIAYGGEILVAGPGSEAVEGNPGLVTVCAQISIKRRDTYLV
ncbi:MAG: DUF1330 domain-containing protein [Pseudomonadales bacterium]